MKITKRTVRFYALLVVLLAMVSIAAVGCKPKVPVIPEGPETGNYYSDNTGSEYLLNLYGGNKFTFTVNSEDTKGTYTVKDNEIKFAFPDGEIGATIADEEISMTYKGKDLIFYRDFEITVTFNTNGGNKIDSVKVRNGHTVQRPSNPEYAGGEYVFVNWYKDSALTQLFDFNERLSADTQLYAKWMKKNEIEYTIGFELGYGAENPESVKTAGGLLVGAPDVQRNGYSFLGWWVSMENKADRLSYLWTEDTVFYENTILFAQWKENGDSARLDSPSVSVKAGSITWRAIPSASTYKIKIVKPDGTTAVDDNFGGTTYPYTFTDTGDYEITVTAIASNTANNSAPTVRYFRNNGLLRVSVFNVDDSKRVFSFLPVSNAKEYFITIECGDDSHTHNEINLNGKTEYSFADCQMREGGILFTVKATADGYVSSTSDIFVYERHLEAAANIRVEDATLLLTWDAVENATSYKVEIGDKSFDTQEREFALKGFDKGTYSIKVTPVAFGFNSPAPSEISYEKKIIATPSNLKLESNKLVWDKVAGATGYKVKIGDKVYDTDKNELDINDKLQFVNGKVSVSVCAMEGSTATLYSDELVLQSDIKGTVTYRANTLSWITVPGAKYEVRIDNNEAIETGESFMKITLPHAGEVKLAVRAYITDWSEWEEITVTAYTLSFNCGGGVGISPRYYAAGDIATLNDVAEYSGYEFTGWYSAAENGTAYNGSVTVTGDLTVYAHYTPMKYTITMNDGTDTQTQKEVTYRSQYELPVPTSEDGTRVFDGWWSGPGGTGTQYTDSEGKSKGVWTVTDNVTVYARWIALFDFELMTLPGTSTQVYAVSKGELFRSNRSDLLERYDTVTIPAKHLGVNVGVIRTDAFAGCNTIITMRIPDTMSLIFSNPFGDRFTNNKLQSIEVYHVEGNNEIRYGAYDGVLYDYGSIDDQAIYGKKPSIYYVPAGKTGDLEVMDGVTSIPTQIFDHSSLVNITIPASVTRIATKAFYICYDLVSVTVLDPKTDADAVGLEIAQNAFFACDLLTTVNLPKRLQSIALTRYVLGNATGTPASQRVENSGDNIEDAFFRSSAMTAVNVAEGGDKYSSKDGVLYNADKTELIYVPEAYTKDSFVVSTGVTKIAAGAFFYVQGIKNIEIAYSVQNIGELAFYMTKLETVTFKGSEIVDGATIGKYAFRDSTVKSVIFESNSHVTTLEEGAFYGCTQLSGFVMPDSLCKIGVQAFRGCTALTSITFGNSEEPVEFGENAFYQSGLQKLIIPKTATKLPELAGLDSLGEIEVDPDSEYFTSINSIIFDKQEEKLLFYPRSEEGEYEIPETVTEIGSGAFQNTSVTKVTIGANVTKIGDSAFEGSAITTVVFTGEGTELDIGNRAFANSCLAALDLPEHTKSVGAYAFYAIETLADLKINEGLTTVGDNAFGGKAKQGYYDVPIYPVYTSVVIPTTLEEVGKEVFAYAASLNEVTFTEGFALTEIPESMFAGTAITSIDIPASVTVIGETAFYMCSELDTVNFLSDKVTTISYGAFAECSSLETIKIPATVTEIGDYAFSKAESLSDVEFDESEEELTIGSYVFQYTNLGDFTLPARVTSIGENCFIQSSITSIDMSETKIEFIPELAFQSCKSLSEVKLPKNLKYIEYNAFVYCESLTSITLPASMQDYNGNYAIGEGAFKASGLTKVLLDEGEYEGTFTIGEEAFYGGSYSSVNNIEVLELPATVTSLEDGFFGGEEYNWYGYTYSAYFVALKSITIKGESEGQRYVSEDGVLYNADKSELIFCPPAKEGKLTIPDTLETVADYAFFGCTEITEIEIPATWDSFDKSMFADCTGLQRVTVADGGKLYLDDKGIMFSEDRKTLLYYPASIKEDTYEIPATVTTIAESAFEYVANIKTITFATRTEDITIGRRAFAGSGLTSFTFPKALISIGEQAFSGCKGLLTVTAEDECKLTTLPNRLFENCSALTTLEIPDHVTEIPDAEPEDGGSLESSYDDKFSIVSGCSSLTKITIKGDALTRIGIYGLYIEDDYYDDLQCNLATVELPASIKEIGHHAFYSNEKLSDLGNKEYNLTTIGKYAFYNCTALADFRFADGLTSIGEGAFYKTAMTEITIPKTVTTIGNDAFRYSKLQSVKGLGGVTDMGQYIFMSCEELTTVVLDEGLTVIGDWMFRGCPLLNSVTLPATLTTICDYAFYECSALSEINLKNVQTIEDYAFSDSGLTSITLPATLTSMGDRVFEYCSELVTVTMNAKLSSISDYTFRGCGSLNGFTLPDALTSIGDYAFYGCESMTEITIPASVTQIGEYAFASAGLISVEIPRDISEIGSHAFAGCTALTNIVLPQGMTEIGAYMFTNTGLTQYVIPDHITTIGEYAFSGCESLASITIGTGVREIGDYAFSGCALVDVTIPSTVETIGAGLFKDNKTLNSVALPDGIEEIPEYTFAGTGLVTYNIPESVTKIGDYAFNNCESLTTLVIPESVTEIGAHGLEGCSSLEFAFPEHITDYGEYALAGILFETVNIPASWTSIPAGIFKGNTSLTTVVFAENHTVTSIGASAFEGCSLLISIDLTGITEIGANAFADCTVLSNIVLPETLTELGDGAFKNCVGITEITIPATLDATELNIASIFEGCDEIEIKFADENVKVYKDVVYGSNNEFLFFLPKAMTRDYVIIMENADLTADALSGADTGLFGEYSSNKGIYTWIKYLVLLPGVKLGNYIFEDWTSDRHIYFVGMSEPTSTPEGWKSSWKSSCSATIHWDVEFDPDTDPLPWESEETDEDNDPINADSGVMMQSYCFAGVKYRQYR